MSNHDSTRRFPAILNEDRYAANGTAPDGAFIAAAGTGINHCIAYRRKVIAEYTFHSRDIPAGVADTPANVLWFACHTGVGADRLVGVFNLAPPSSSGTDPYVTMAVTDGFSGGSTTESSPELHYGGLSTSWADAPDYISWGGVTEVSVDPDTDYRVAVRLYDYARVLSFCIYEVGLATVDTTKGGVDPRIGVGSPVYDGPTEQYVKAASEAWRHNAGNILNFAAYNDGYTDWSITIQDQPTPVNLFDGSTGTVSASSYGYRVNLQYHNSVNQSEVPVVLAVLAEATNITDSDNKVIIADSSGSLIEVDTIATGGPAWYTATGTLPADENQKLDIMVQTYNDMTEIHYSVTVYSVCLYELD